MVQLNSRYWRRILKTYIGHFAQGMAAVRDHYIGLDVMFERCGYKPHLHLLLDLR